MGTLRSAGFTLVETLVAMGLLATGLVAMAQLGVESVRAGLVAGAITQASILASSKVEQLRTGPLTPSPPGTLDANVPGHVDHLDRAGRVVGAGVDPPGDAAFTRRWAVAPAAGAPALRVVHVEARPRGEGAALTTVRVTALVGGSDP